MHTYYVAIEYSTAAEENSKPLSTYRQFGRRRPIWPRENMWKENAEVSDSENHSAPLRPNHLLSYADGYGHYEFLVLLTNGSYQFSYSHCES
jgi:hypothetical protein